MSEGEPMPRPNGTRPFHAWPGPTLPGGVSDDVPSAEAGDTPPFLITSAFLRRRLGSTRRFA